MPARAKPTPKLRTADAAVAAVAAVAVADTAKYSALATHIDTFNAREAAKIPSNVTLPAIKPIDARDVLCFSWFMGTSFS